MIWGEMKQARKESLREGLDREARELYDHLSERYPLKEVDLRLEAQTFRLVTVANVDLLLDELIGEGEDSEAYRDERLPYWAELWPASIALARDILRPERRLRGLEVLELGCGLGLASIAAARRGAKVVLSDYQPLALSFAELNGRLNLGYPPPTVEMDWRSPDLERPFDLLLASDLTYEQRLFAPLIQAFRALLRPSGAILLSEPNRPVAQEFFQRLHDEGFSFEHRSIMTSVPYLNMEVAVGLYEIGYDQG